MFWFKPFPEDLDLSVSFHKSFLFPSELLLLLQMERQTRLQNIECGRKKVLGMRFLEFFICYFSTGTKLLNGIENT